MENNPDEDGYDIVATFLNKNPKILENAMRSKGKLYTDPLLKAYLPKKNGATDVTACPAWVLLELLSFGELLIFIEFYNKRNPARAIWCDRSILNPVKDLRNTCVHNNCLLRDMRSRHAGEYSTIPSSKVSNYVAQLFDGQFGFKIGKGQRNKKLSSRPIFDIVCLGYALEHRLESGDKKTVLVPLRQFVDKRLMENIDLFGQNDLIITTFQFLKKFIDIISER